MMMLTMILCKFGKGMNGYEDMHVVYFLFLSLSVICHIVPLLLLLLRRCNEDMVAMFSLINLINEIPSLCIKTVVALDHIMILVYIYFGWICSRKPP